MVVQLHHRPAYCRMVACGLVPPTGAAVGWLVVVAGAVALDDEVAVEAPSWAVLGLLRPQPARRAAAASARENGAQAAGKWGERICMLTPRTR